MSRMKKLLSQMTIEEKIGQLIQLNGNDFIKTDIDLTGSYDKLEIPNSYIEHIGSSLTLNPGDSFILQRKHLENDSNKIPMIFMMDVIHGYRTIYPIPLALGASFNPEIAEECSEMAAEEASAGGIHVTFTPMVDLARDARWGRILETGGESSFLNGVIGAAQVRGFQGKSLKDEKSLAACVKHYAAYGAAISGKDYNAVDMSEATLRDYYLPAYKACMDAGVAMVMASFNTLNGIPAIANSFLMKQILKDEWNFDGVVISDYNAVRELIVHGVAEDKKEAAKLAFENGCDIEMCSDTYYLYLKELIEEGVFTEEQLDRAVLRVLELKDKLGLFDNPYRGYTDKPEEIYLSDKNRKISRIAAEESAVLLKNNGILPLSKDINKIALIGPYANNKSLNGAWSCCGNTEETVSVYEGIKNLIPDAEIIVEEGCSYEAGNICTDGFDRALSAAKDADAVILCLGEPAEYSGEANCRAYLELPGMQDKLVSAITGINSNCVAVIFSGRPNILTTVSEKASAVLHMWFPGTEGGNATANLLFGNANPSGKITATFPRATGQCPIYHDRLLTGRPRTTDDKFQPYTSGYVDCRNSPLYPFGFGLSYSDFRYESLELSSNEITEKNEIKVSITVKNESERAGKETVLLFLRDKVASSSQPIQKLINFRKVEFKPYERKTIEFTVAEKDLRFCNFQNKFISEKGEFLISTGYADNLIFTKSLYLK